MEDIFASILIPDLLRGKKSSNLKIYNKFIYLLGHIIDSLTSGSIESSTTYRFLQAIDINNNREFIDFLSMNWDIFLDHALETLNLRVNYGLSDELLIDTHPLANHQHHVNVCKIHGSFNWMKCMKCKKTFLIHKQKGIFESARNQLTHDHGDEGIDYRFIPDIIPPSYLERFKTSMFTRLMNNAIEMIMQSNNIVIIGYSFPDADVHMRYALLQGLKGRKTSVTIVDPAPRIDRISPFIPAREIHVVAKTFKEYIVDLEIPIDIY